MDKFPQQTIENGISEQVDEKYQNIYSDTYFKGGLEIKNSFQQELDDLKLPKVSSERSGWITKEIESKKDKIKARIEKEIKESNGNSKQFKELSKSLNQFNLKIQNYSKAGKVITDLEDAEAVIEELNNNDIVILGASYSEYGMELYVAPVVFTGSEKFIKTEEMEKNNQQYSKEFFSDYGRGKDIVYVEADHVKYLTDLFPNIEALDPGGYKKPYKVGDYVRFFEKNENIEDDEYYQIIKEKVSENIPLFNKYVTNLNDKMGEDSPFAKEYSNKLMDYVHGENFENIIFDQKTLDKEFLKNFLLSLFKNYSILNCPNDLLESLDDKEKKILEKILEESVIEENGVQKKYLGMQQVDTHPGQILVLDNGTTKIIDHRDLVHSNDQAWELAESMGVPAYMSVERYMSVSSKLEKSDVYALGVMIWEMLVKDNYYYESDMGIFSRKIHEPNGLKIDIKQIKYDLSEEQKLKLIEIIKMTTLRDINKRYSSAQAYKKLKDIFISE